jgi:hypothetical protein
VDTFSSQRLHDLGYFDGRHLVCDLLFE